MVDGWWFDGNDGGGGDDAKCENLEIGGGDALGFPIKEIGRAHV